LDPTLVTAMSGVLGSLVGASASVATTWVAQKTVSRRELIRAEMSKREMLYGEFVSECAKILVDAFVHTLEKPEIMLPVYSLINRIRLTASAPVLAAAENLLRRITEQYFATNMTVEEIRRLAVSGEGDPLKLFGEACRAELGSMRSQL
jgi:hypothetical protein